MYNNIFIEPQLDYTGDSSLGIEVKNNIINKVLESSPDRGNLALNCVFFPAARTSPKDSYTNEVLEEMHQSLATKEIHEEHPNNVHCSRCEYVGLSSE